MQSDRYSNPKTAVSTCIWCSDDYTIAVSRATDSALFCRRRCDMEARCWLYELLKDILPDSSQ